MKREYDAKDLHKVRVIANDKPRLIRLAIAVFVSRGGTRKPVMTRVVKPGGEAEAFIEHYCEQASKHLKNCEQLIPQVISIPFSSLEENCKNVRFLDDGK